MNNDVYLFSVYNIHRRNHNNNNTKINDTQKPPRENQVESHLFSLKTPSSGKMVSEADFAVFTSSMRPSVKESSISNATDSNKRDIPPPIRIHNTKEYFEKLIKHKNNIIQFTKNSLEYPIDFCFSNELSSVNYNKNNMNETFLSFTMACIDYFEHHSYKNNERENKKENEDKKEKEKDKDKDKDKEKEKDKDKDKEKDKDKDKDKEKDKEKDKDEIETDETDETDDYLFDPFTNMN